MSVKKVSFMTFTFVYIFAFCFLTLCTGIKVEASSQYVTDSSIEKSKKVNGVTISCKQNYPDNEDGGYNSTYTLTMKKGNKTAVVTQDSTHSFATNGKVIYYAERTREVSEESYWNTIYKYDFSSGKQTKLVAGSEYKVAACNGKYLYYGEDWVADGMKLYCMNLKTKKKKYMRAGVGQILFCGKYVVVDTIAGDVDNYPIHLFGVDGKKKRKIANGILIRAKKNKIYYARVNLKNYRYKVYRYNIKKKKKVAVTKWVKVIPSKYYAAKQSGKGRKNSSYERTAEPSKTAFLSKKDFENDNFNSIYNLDVGASRRVYFGKNGQRWYIAGKNSDGTLALMCDPEKPFGKMQYSSEWWSKPLVPGSGIYEGTIKVNPFVKTLF